MKIDCISDLHGFYPKLDGGDLLIIAGDLMLHDKLFNYLKFFHWIANTKYKKRIVIAGNHDILEQKEKLLDIIDDFTYLCDSGTEIESFKVWGSPWTLEFEGENPNCLAFTCKTEEELARKWELIPNDTDILITHAPPYAMMDETIWKENVGSISLAQRIEKLSKLKLHVFGHIHESYGVKKIKDFISVNASYVNHQYKPVNKPIRIELCLQEE